MREAAISSITVALIMFSVSFGGGGVAVANWTAGQKVEGSILHLEHVLAKNSPQ